MSKLYENRRTGKLLFLAVSGIVVAVFLVFSNSLVKELAQQERERMNIWAHATEKLTRADANADIEFLLGIISQNNTIPVLVADSAFNILEARNFDLPDTKPGDEGFAALTDDDRQYLTQLLRDAAHGRTLAQMADTDHHFIRVNVGGEYSQYIYYEDSILLRRLSYYPYVQLAGMIVIALILYLAVVYSKRAEQNRVWAGLSKETAHQLGTPISSLMAWVQLLESYGVSQDIVGEIDKDVKRLSTIAERFSKIGSVPESSLEYVNDTIRRSLDYLRHRVSDRVEIDMNLSEDDHAAMLSPLLFDWVMENLTKNAVDAMEGAGRLTIRTFTEKDKVIIEVSDTGKGIARKNFRTVFNPGYTTKKRGWGLGLTLVKRIVEEYHRGRIFVKESEPGKGTTFRIEIPAA